MRITDIMFQKSFTLLCVCAVIQFTSAINIDYGKEFMLQNIKQWQNNLKDSEGASQKCNEQLTKWGELLIKGPIMTDNWAWRMLDASDKINAGILTGNLNGLGQMDECLAIDEIYEGSDIKGQFCYAGMILPMGATEAKFNLAPANNTMNRFRNMMADGLVLSTDETQPAINYMMSICIPHECDWMEITGLNEITDMDLCQTKDTNNDYEGGDWAFIVFFIIVAVLVVISSSYDWYIRHNNKKPAHPITLAFSFYTNGEKLLRITNNPEQLQSLNGIRAISMMWVVTGHRFNVSSSTPIVNLTHVMEWMSSTKSFYITAAPVAVDSFFFLSGVVMAYGFMKSQSKPKARFNIILYYIHRYLRLTPAVGVLYFFYVTVFKHITSGPLWPLLQKGEVDNCLNNALSYFLYIQNIINPDRHCLGHTWYLSVDMQLFIISPLILLPMVKFPKYAGYGLVGLILLSILPPTLISYCMDMLSRDPDYFKHYYSQPYTRCAPWLVGLLLGYLFYQLRDCKVKINWLVNLSMWAGILVGMFFILFSTPEVMDTTDIAAFAVFNGFHRLCWALGLMWIVFACEKGYGGIVNWFLSLPLFQVLARLSYSMYLIHVLVQFMAVFRKRAPFFFDDYNMLNEAFGDIVVVTCLAFFYCMMFESPMVVVEKMLFAPSGYIMKLFGLGRKIKDKDDKVAALSQVTSQHADVTAMENGHADDQVNDSKEILGA